MRCIVFWSALFTECAVASPLPLCSLRMCLPHVLCPRVRSEGPECIAWAEDVTGGEYRLWQHSYTSKKKKKPVSFIRDPYCRAIDDNRMLSVSKSLLSLALTRKKGGDMLRFVPLTAAVASHREAHSLHQCTSRVWCWLLWLCSKVLWESHWKENLSVILKMNALKNWTVCCLCIIFCLLSLILIV